MNTKFVRVREYWWTATLPLIPFFVYLYAYPLQLLNINNTSFVTTGDLGTLDAAQSVAGLNSFIRQPWSMHPGSLSKLGVQGHNSILFSDSTPWFSFLAKIYVSCFGVGSNVIQFIGIELLISLILLYGSLFLYFRWEGLRPLHAVLGSLLFMLLPELQIHWIWPSLMYQFLIVLGIWLARSTYVISTRRARMLWSGLAFLSAMSHTYFFPMIFALLLMATMFKFKEFYRRNISLLACALGGFLFGNYLAGGFNAGFTGAAAGVTSVGPYAADLFSYINPRHLSSFFGSLNSQPSMESFAYPGVAFLILFIVSRIPATSIIKKISPTRFEKRKTEKHKNFSKKVIERSEESSRLPFKFLNIAGILLFIIAIGPSVPIDGKYHWITHNITIIKLSSVFRASGRFAWVLVFTLGCFAIVKIAKTHKTQLVTSILAICLALQVFEFNNFTNLYRNNIKTMTASHEIPTRINLDPHNPLYFYPAFPAPDTTPWRTYLIDFLAEGGIDENFAYMSRNPTSYMINSIQESQLLFNSQTFPKNSYVVMRNDYLDRYKQKHTKIEEIGTWTIIQNY